MEEEISDTISHIQDLKIAGRASRNKGCCSCAKRKRRSGRLRKTIAVSFLLYRDLPEDVLRQICIAYVADSIPTLSSDQIPLPYVLSPPNAAEMRRIVLTTPIIWARMNVVPDFRSDRLTYSVLASRAIEWFERERMGCLSLYTARILPCRKGCQKTANVKIRLTFLSTPLLVIRHAGKSSS